MGTDYEEAVNKFAYDPQTGRLSFKRTTGKLAGKTTGYLYPNGYLYVYLAGKRHPAHRVIWLMATGNWPTGCIDHIDGNKLNNRLSNLRDVSAFVNSVNRHKARVDSKSGLIGVYQQDGRYYANIHRMGTKYSLGGFPSADEAAQARSRAAAVYHKEN